MQGTLKVSPEKLRQAASEFQNAGNSVKTATGQMTEKVTSLSGNIWSGDASTAYKNKFNGLQDDIAKLQQMITEHVNDLNSMATNYANAEKANTEASASLASDVIS